MDQDSQPSNTPNKPTAGPTFSDVQPPPQKPAETTPTSESPPAPTPTGTVTQAPVVSSDGGSSGGKKKMLVWVVIIIVLIVGGAAAAYFVMKKSNNPPAKTSSKPPVSTQQSVSISPDVVNANNTFGTSVLNNLVQATPTANVFISPTSIAMALSMVYNGAAGSTLTAMQQTLGYQNINLSTINSTNQNIINGLKDPDSKVTLNMANSVWIKQGFTPKQTFLNTVQTDYQAKASTLDFTNPSALTTINNWVAQATDNKIPTIISQIPPQEVMYLINAMYFNGEWTNAFNPSSTTNQPFTNGAGTKVQVPTMTQQGTFKYLDSNTLQAIQLPYGTNQRLAMDVFLPGNMTTYLKSLNYSQLQTNMSQLKSEQGTIDLPKFTLTYGQNLNTVLKALGMSVAFNPTSADFSNIGSNLYISDVMHKAYIDVNEQGTQAAAATSVGVSASDVSANPTPSFTMDVNKPFLFTIVDTKTNEVLFIGSVQDPSAS